MGERPGHGADVMIVPLPALPHLWHTTALLDCAKWALEALSDGLACEMKTFGVRVTGVPVHNDQQCLRSVMAMHFLRLTRWLLATQLSD